MAIKINNTTVIDDSQIADLNICNLTAYTVDQLTDDVSPK